MKEKSNNESSSSITSQTIIVGGCRITLNFLLENNEDLGATIRSLLLNGDSIVKNDWKT